MKTYRVQFEVNDDMTSEDFGTDEYQADLYAALASKQDARDKTASVIISENGIATTERLFFAGRFDFEAPLDVTHPGSTETFQIAA